MKRVLYITTAIAVTGGLAFAVMNHGTTKAAVEPVAQDTTATTAPADTTPAPQPAEQAPVTTPEQVSSSPADSTTPTDPTPAPASDRQPTVPEQQPGSPADGCDNSTHACFVMVGEGNPLPN